MKAIYSVIILSLVAIMLSFLIYCTSAYFYPMRYTSEIKEVCGQYDLEPSLVASVINVESGYNPNRTSPKGAKGLMQIMPSTAEWLCEKLRLEYNEERLYEVEYNLVLGCYYLKSLMGSFEDTVSALCAYNAGPTNVRNWLSDSKYSSDGKTLNNIPFAETENYVTKLNKNLKYYSRKYK